MSLAVTYDDPNEPHQYALVPGRWTECDEWPPTRPVEDRRVSLALVHLVATKTDPIFATLPKEKISEEFQLLLLVSIARQTLYADPEREWSRSFRGSSDWSKQARALSDDAIQRGLIGMRERPDGIQFRLRTENWDAVPVYEKGPDTCAGEA